MSSLPKLAGPYATSCVDIETDKVLVRIFYPTTTASAGTSSWLPNNWFYAKGYANFIKNSLLAILFYPIMSACRVPVATETAFLRRETRYPIVVYSHGLGGMRTTYTAFCANLASYGMVVASIEHRDLSACVSMRDGYRTRLEYDRPKRGDDEFVREFRRAQIGIRVGEVRDTVQLLRDLDDGKVVLNKFSSKFDLGLLRDSMDWDKVVMSGHSFGSATAIAVLQQSDHPFSIGVVQDPWMLPVVPSSISVPVYSLQSEKFHWPANIRSIRSQFTDDLGASSVFGCVRKTAHQSFSDFCPFFPRLMRLSGLGGLGDPGRAIGQIVESSVEFIHLNLGIEGYVSVVGDEDYFGRERCDGDLVFGEDGFRLIYKSLDLPFDDKRA